MKNVYVEGWMEGLKRGHILYIETELSMKYLRDLESLIRDRGHDLRESCECHQSVYGHENH